MRGEPPHYTSVLPLITIRPYYNSKAKRQFRHFINLIKMQKGENHQNAQFTNDENEKSCHFLPLRMRGSDFGLKTGSRGTPWNSKSAQPGGSDFTKCRFWPFKWHFGVFGGVSIFDTFLSLFHFFILSLFHILHFSVFSILSLFQFCHFLMIFEFCHFWWFSHFFIILIYFLTFERVS